MRWVVVTKFSILILIGFLFTGTAMAEIEKPDYEVIQSQENIEVRRYAAMIIAGVEVNGTRKDASSDGFRLLADYIFGNNTVQQDIAMTAPVQQKESTKIAMTVPVQQQSTGQDKTWQISFVMPQEYTMQSIPQPNNDKVKLIEIPAKTMAAITFRGSFSDKNISKYQMQLLNYIEANQLNASGLPGYAQYSPPWVPPFLRKTEIMFEIN